MSVDLMSFLNEISWIYLMFFLITIIIDLNLSCKYFTDFFVCFQIFMFLLSFKTLNLQNIRLLNNILWLLDFYLLFYFRYSYRDIFLLFFRLLIQIYIFQFTQVTNFLNLIFIIIYVPDSVSRLTFEVRSHVLLVDAKFILSIFTNVKHSLFCFAFIQIVI